ncbi:aldehyde dehydrogenase [Burkholderia multivorans]|uniref:aldehyde dehydrogenase n=1 Tax=Burkholderia multivorans TaxID=87883 RepID=UPI0020B230AD|nr:aldehyde dehydrogenase [Burkholderia multivorans]MBU9553335.1 aldehyde dehydrogenase [Burkholderia multivorans]
MESSKKTFAEWNALADSLRIEGRAFIDGAYTQAASGSVFQDASPIDGRVLATVAECDAADVERAVAAAKRTFESRAWAGRTPAERKETLLRLADLVDANRHELAVLETLDSGKTIRESLDMDMRDVAKTIRYYAESIDKLHDLIAPTGEQFHGMITREPIGVVAVMAPWNNPLMIACWKAIPALVAGNSVVFKPSEKSPLTAIRFAQLVQDAGVPAGAFNVVPGGPAVGQALAMHADVGAMAFTGSSKVAKQLLVYAGQSNMKRMYLEGGGKNAHIVFADTPDLERVARFAALGFCANQGEVCASGTRLFVESSIVDRFTELLTEAVQAWQPGHPLDPSTAMGALIDADHHANVQRYVDSAATEGARIVAGGKRVDVVEGGAYFPPTVIANATPDMTVSREEIFGPVVAVMSFSTEDEVVRLANDTPYGLTAGFWTPDIAKAHRVARRLQAGTVWVNHFLTRDILSPFGGFKQSGIGRDLSIHAIQQYTEMKATWIALEPPAGV